MKLAKRIILEILFVWANLIASTQSVITRAKAFGKRPVIHVERPYKGQKILLLALYARGRLRADIQTLLITAKQLGFYVMAINSLKLLEPENTQHNIDCYIERPNFGRDFGSYKVGFLHIFKRGWDQQCPRLIMLNDSIFYSQKPLRSFLTKMMMTDMEVLGATESHEINYHLGSFCISISHSVVQHQILKKFWVDYSNTDVRPKVILNGEVKLSKKLRQCVSQSEKFGALFDVTFMANFLDTNNEPLNNCVRRYRGSNKNNALKSPSPRRSFDRVNEKYIWPFQMGKEIDNNYFIDHMDMFVDAVAQSVTNVDANDIRNQVCQEVKNDLLESFISGSQIHNNNILLHYCGLPLIKLDLLFRGVFRTDDVEKIAADLTEHEKNNFRRLIYSRPYGGDTLRGMKKVAFYRGLI